MTGASDGQTCPKVTGYYLGRRPTAKYSIVGETLRSVVPSHLQCSIGCGGKACKYEDPTRWTDDQQAIKGIYSSWVTEKLLAMARPSTEVIEKFKVIDQFRRCNIRTVINLQKPGEHANCGNPLEPLSGFSYCPEAFMEAGIFFYNYGWNDYGVGSLAGMLDIMKVMSFAVQEGKVAVHCHAGLGRTGVLLACFLVYSTRMSADQSIQWVRDKRPNSIQTRGQLQCVRQFAQFLEPVRSVFSCAAPHVRPFTLAQYLVRQKNMLHGYEMRQLRHLPKLVHMVCKLLPDIADNREIIAEEILDVPEMTEEMEDAMVDAIHSFRMMSRRWEQSKGQSGLPPRLPGLPWGESEKNPLHYSRKSLSFSDTDLQRLGSKLDLVDNPLTVVAGLNCPSLMHDKRRTESVSVTLPGSPTPTQASPTGSQGSVWDIKTEMDKREGSPLMRRRQENGLQRSKSAIDTRNGMSSVWNLSGWRTSQRSEEMLRSESGMMGSGLRLGSGGGGGEVSTAESEYSEVPFITLQSELTLESKHLLLAQALALDLERDGQDDHKDRVTAWQEELNRGAGVWEHLCLERDPFILAALMWSWLEQLKEPVLSVQDVQALGQGDAEPKSTLDSLDKAPKETLMCVLECFAHALDIPEAVDDAFLERITKAFTQIEKDSSEDVGVYQTMLSILRPILTEMRRVVQLQLELQ
ncbi:protein tyrosine phosphatase domain-containing protein 1 [Engraulis encrasicolus]|uniref:protein tyrosine phosphatase domain-containing protein 1 n=1 Tax=Engraulis encrasicolus TaxID=184585 RepID=UPI002FD3E74C